MIESDAIKQRKKLSKERAPSSMSGKLTIRQLLSQYSTKILILISDAPACKTYKKDLCRNKIWTNIQVDDRHCRRQPDEPESRQGQGKVMRLDS